MDKNVSPKTTNNIYMTSAWIFNRLCHEKADGSIGFKNPLLPDKSEIPYVETMKSAIGGLETSANVLKDELSRNSDGKSGFLDVCFAAEDDIEYNAGGINRFVNYVSREMNRGQDLVPQI